MMGLEDAIRMLNEFVDTGNGNASDIANAVEVVLLHLARLNGGVGRITMEILKAYAEFAEDIGDSITASLFPSKTDEEALAEIAQADERLKKSLRNLEYKPPERPWKRGVGRIKR